ncbi:MAG: hypothetical protein FJ033_12755 [Chloroflexi bacterium]|nr:hypothetical protein [Chloroflexota bacterium]
MRLTSNRTVNVIIPRPTADLIVDRARSLWGSNALLTTGAVTTVFVRPTRNGQRSIAASPIGAFHITFDSPTHGQATIVRLEWGTPTGGTEDDIRQFLNGLTGWPVVGYGLPRTA